MSSSALVAPTAAASSAPLAAPTTAALTSTALVPTASLPYSQPPTPPASPAEAFNALTAAIYGMQRQLGDLSLRVTALEGRPSPSSQPFQYGLPGYGGIPALPASGPTVSEYVSVPSYQPPFQPALPPSNTRATTVGALLSPPPPSSMGVPITHISFPPSPSPVPSLSSIMQGASFPSPSAAMPTAPMHLAPTLPHIPPEPAGSAVPRFHKLSFPTYDGKDDPLAG